MSGRSGMLAVGLGFLVSGPLVAQDKQGKIELGLDAGFATRLNDPKVSVIAFPVQQFRIGFFVSNRVEVEPAASFNWAKPSGGDSFSEVIAALGVLFHFGDDASKTRVYLRPFAGLDHAAASGQTATSYDVGGGLGVKVPIGSRLDARLEGGYLHGFKHDAIAASDHLQLLVGLSFLTK